MSAHVLLILFNELGFCNAFNKFNDTGARMLDLIYHNISLISRNVIMDVVTFSENL